MAHLTDAFTQVLVAIDESPLGTEALRRAAGITNSVGAGLTVLHVATPVAASFAAPRAHARAERAARLNGERLLEAAREAAVGTALTAEIQFGDPAEIICRRATEIGADLVVVGSRRLGAIDRLLLGSVSGAVMRCAPCSVLVVWPRA